MADIYSVLKEAVAEAVKTSEKWTSFTAAASFVSRVQALHTENQIAGDIALLTVEGYIGNRGIH